MSGHAPVEVVEEAKQVEPELDEALLLVVRQRTEDLCRVVHMVLITDPTCAAVSRSLALAGPLLRKGEKRTY